MQLLTAASHLGYLAFSSSITSYGAAILSTYQQIFSRQYIGALGPEERKGSNFCLLEERKWQLSSSNNLRTSRQNRRTMGMKI